MKTSAANPLLETTGHPRFAAIRAEHVEPAVRQRIAESERLLEQLLKAPGTPTWESLVAPLDEADERLERAWEPIEHLVHVLHDDALREAHRRTHPLVAEYGARRMQDERLWRCVQTIRDHGRDLSPERRKILDDSLRDFRLAGVHLPPKERSRCREIQVELSKIAVEFGQHVTDATDAFRLVIEREEDLAGLPPTLVAAARAQALRDDPSAPPSRWTFTLHQSVVVPFVAHQEDRGLREQMLRAHVTRATAAPYDNGPLIRRTLELRAELAHLLGFANYAELSLERKMATSPSEVHAFLSDLADRARPHAIRERDELAGFAKRRDGIGALERHDVTYYRELLREERFRFSDEDVRRYFPLDRVFGGLCDVVERLYGVKLTDRTGAAGFETWHPEVRVIEASDAGHVVGHVYFDPFARRGKQAGAWVGGMVARRRLADGAIQLPAAYLVCNFPAPAEGQQCNLRHEEVRTFFHEFGHALHHVLTRVEERVVSGTHGVPRDGVELPSQFFENWIWHEEPLTAMSGDAESGAPLPKALFAQMLAARSFMRACDLVRQMELALFDLELHMSFAPHGPVTVHQMLEAVRDRVAVFPAPPYDRFENAFLHIFAGGYAAGYYGYAWAEVLAADAFARFEEEGIWSATAARDFRETILAQGGGADFMDLYVAFRGRKPTADALLRHAGLT